jgi:hypothetical protein
VEAAELLDEMYDQCLVKDLATFDRAARRYILLLFYLYESPRGGAVENPATWKRAEVTLMNAYEEWHQTTSAGAVGPSIGKFLADALRRENLLRDEDEPELGWVKLRELRNRHNGR